MGLVFTWRRLSQARRYGDHALSVVYAAIRAMSRYECGLGGIGCRVGVPGRCVGQTAAHFAQPRADERGALVARGLALPGQPEPAVLPAALGWERCRRQLVCGAVREGVQRCAELVTIS